MKNICLLLFLYLLPHTVSAQDFPQKQLLRKLKADRITMDNDNEDGVFMARNKKSKKWGMYQWKYDGIKTTELIPMQYDSIKPFPYNGKFTAVYNNGKTGFYLSPWSYYEKANQSVPCLYGDFQFFIKEGVIYLGVEKEGKWGWVNWLTAKEESEFIYNSKEDLPYATWTQKEFFEDMED